MNLGCGMPRGHAAWHKRSHRGQTLKNPSHELFKLHDDIRLDSSEGIYTFISAPKELFFCICNKIWIIIYNVNSFLDNFAPVHLKCFLHTVIHLLHFSFFLIIWKSCHVPEDINVYLLKSLSLIPYLQLERFIWSR